MSALDAREGYRLWAHDYHETAITFLDDLLVREMGPAPAGLRLLDAGCGTGRRLRGSGAALAVGVDLTPEMLAAADPPGGLAAGDLRALPLRDAAFDLVWCRLAIGHLPEIGDAYRELARVCRPGGSVIVTDFHADAIAAGHRRTFCDASRRSHELAHYVHPAEAQAAAARAAGLALAYRRDGEVGPAVRPFYERADRLGSYEKQQGLRLVLALAFRRE
ncbi:MAG TPA: class I SAM-dependent methyltransferase [Longimicrobium sp.]|nr:class I SAM-dependent methyltransferase [Longimicrobium sp.]